jgi:hypothetical protein
MRLSLNFISFNSSAAQNYNIPRKTLRNWMKRLHIKSKFPMPKQLAKAAQRKKTESVQMHTIVKSESDFDTPMEEKFDREILN